MSEPPTGGFGIWISDSADDEPEAPDDSEHIEYEFDVDVVTWRQATGCSRAGFACSPISYRLTTRGCRD